MLDHETNALLKPAWPALSIEELTAAPEKFFSNPGTERARQFIQRYAGHAANGGR